MLFIDQGFHWSLRRKCGGAKRAEHEECEFFHDLDLVDL
jgi:hypothetical protein